MKLNFLYNILTFLVFCLISSCQSSDTYLDLNNNGKRDLYENPNLDSYTRAESIVAELSVSEKIAQLESNAPAINRLGISNYNWMNEALHGIRGDHEEITTVFPQAIGLAATWNPKLAWEQGNAISDEARGLANSRGNDRYLDFWSPVINIGRDPRWGRTQEGYGEDPKLVSEISTAIVRGLQGNHSRYYKVLSAPKHFVANNEEYRRHSGSSNVPMKVLRDYYLPAFRSCIIDANARSIMSAYNALNGVPCTANNLLLNDILRDEWGFTGWVVSDCGAVYDVHKNHKYTKDPLQATAISLKAGTDLNCGSYYRLYLEEAYDKGLVLEDDINQAAIRLFQSRIELGVFDPPSLNPYSKIGIDVVDSEKHKRIAHTIALQSLVLLRNKDDFLPLNKSVNSIAVIGPNANFCRFGTYSGKPSKQITPLEGIKEIIPNAKVDYAQGTSILEPQLPSLNDSLFFINDSTPGIIAEYYKGLSIKKDVDLIRIESSPNIKWGMNGTPDSTNFEPNNFCTRMIGNVKVESSGYYKININGIDGIRFYFKDSLVVDKLSENYSHTTFISDYLEKGKLHSFVIEYYEDEGWGEVRMGMKEVTKGLESEALSVAKSNDMVIMFAGTYDYIEAEGRDRADTELPKDQKELLKKLYSVNPNLCLVLINGSTISMPWASENIPAILEAWYPGQSGGRAIAEALFGDYNPGGKLPITFYKNLSQLLPFDDYDIRKGRTYMYLKDNPLYPFGYGLSYTEFDIASAHIDKESYFIDDSISLSFKISNTGGVIGSEVPQVYIERNNVKRLKAFKRVFLDNQETKKVELKISVEDLELWDENSEEYKVEPGNYTIHLGTSSVDIEWSKSFTIL